MRSESRGGTDRRRFVTSVGGDDHETTAAAICGGATLDVNYIALILGSCAIATFGLLENSVAVIIGAMIIAPLMTVIQAVALGALDGRADVFRRGAITLVVGVACAIVLSALIAKVSGLSQFGSEIIGRTRPNLLDLGIALAAGLIGGFARVRPAIANTVAGTAIAVALMPPLCVVGIGLAHWDRAIAEGALLLFLTNLLGITLTSMAVFLVAKIAHRPAASAIAWTAGLTALIVVPLGFSFRTLAREAALESALRAALTTQTVTFRNATLVSSRFDWLASPPTAELLIRATAVPSQHQVALLEGFAQHATGQAFRLVIDIAQTQQITSGTPLPAADDATAPIPTP
jgi:uncharacterized hydrophobic protein (TIGR00271 family)